MERLRPTIERRFIFRNARGICALVIVLLGVWGCGGDGYPTADVTGTVTYRGTPIPNLWVQFSRAEPGGSGPAAVPPALGGTDSEGRYRLMRPRNKPGAGVGRYRVTFSIAEGTGGFPSGVPIDEVLNRTVDVEVKSGSNVLDFAL